MAGEYGVKTLYRAAKADVLSLTFFEIGLFGWMAIFQVAIFNWRLEMNTVTYWWMMQVRFLPRIVKALLALPYQLSGRLACFSAIGRLSPSIGG